MKMQVIAKEDIPIYLKKIKGSYSEVYETIDGLKSGKRLLYNLRTRKRPTYLQPLFPRISVTTGNAMADSKIAITRSHVRM